MTARMRGNMTVNAGEFSTFLKELVNTGYIKISTGPGTWEKDIFRATTFVLPELFGHARSGLPEPGSRSGYLL